MLSNPGPGCVNRKHRVLVAKVNVATACNAVRQQYVLMKFDRYVPLFPGFPNY